MRKKTIPIKGKLADKSMFNQGLIRSEPSLTRYQYCPDKVKRLRYLRLSMRKGSFDELEAPDYFKYRTVKKTRRFPNIVIQLFFLFLVVLALLLIASKIRI